MDQASKVYKTFNFKLMYFKLRIIFIFSILCTVFLLFSRDLSNDNDPLKKVELDSLNKGLF
jgi:hypothetical protein